MGTPDPWFTPKTYGYGATPANWKGWAATLVYALVVTAVSVVWFGLDERASVGFAEWAGWLAGVAIATLAFVALARHRTQGDWRWRWGAD